MIWTEKNAIFDLHNLFSSSSFFLSPNISRGCNWIMSNFESQMRLWDFRCQQNKECFYFLKVTSWTFASCWHSCRQVDTWTALPLTYFVFEPPLNSGLVDTHHTPWHIIPQVLFCVCHRTKQCIKIENMDFASGYKNKWQLFLVRWLVYFYHTGT